GICSMTVSAETDVVTLTVKCPLCEWSERQRATGTRVEPLDRALRQALRVHFEFTHVNTTITREPVPLIEPQLYRVSLLPSMRAALHDLLTATAPPPPGPNDGMPMRDQLLRAVLEAQPIFVD